MKKLALYCLTAIAIVGCSDANVASSNISKAADQFEVNRRIVFYNGITGDYVLTIQGLCSIGSGDAEKTVTITCKTGAADYKKHFLRVSDNVTYFVEQIDNSKTDIYQYRVVFKPKTLLPNFELVN